MREESSKQKSSLRPSTLNRITPTQESSLSFSEIPRAALDSHDSSFLYRSQKAASFFEAAQSEEEYLRIIPPSIRKRPPVQFSKRERNDKVWNFFEGLNKLQSDSDSEIDEEEQGSTPTDPSVSGNRLGGPRQNLNRGLTRTLEVVANQEESVGAPYDDDGAETQKTQDINERKSASLYQKINKLHTVTKTIEVSCKPERYASRKAREGQTTCEVQRPQQRYFGNIGIKKEPETVFFELKTQDIEQVETNKRTSRFEMRKTRMPPLRYWAGERVQYGKKGAEGVWIIQSGQEPKND